MFLICSFAMRSQTLFVSGEGSVEGVLLADAKKANKGRLPGRMTPNLPKPSGLCLLEQTYNTVGSLVGNAQGLDGQLLL